jgi:hypothetical protein
MRGQLHIGGVLLLHGDTGNRLRSLGLADWLLRVWYDNLLRHHHRKLHSQGDLHVIEFNSSFWLCSM